MNHPLLSVVYYFERVTFFLTHIFKQLIKELADVTKILLVIISDISGKAKSASRRQLS